MSTETQTTTPTTEAPAPSGDDFSPAEREYFESRGERGGMTDDPPPAPAAAAPSGEPPKDDGDSIEGEIVIDEQGNRRDKRSGRFVPHGAFHAERTRRQAVEQTLQQEREARARLEERANILAQALQAPAPAAPNGQPAPAADLPPDPKEDVFGYIAWQQRQMEKLQGELQETRKTTTERLENREIADSYRADAAAFVRETPDFGQAYMHLVKSIDAELQFRGIADAKQRTDMIARMEREEVAQARAAGKRPAEWIYNLAKWRGYSGAPQSGQTPPTVLPQTQSQPAPASAPVPSRLDAVERGQSAGFSLTQAGGGAPQQLTLEALVGMSEAEYAALPKDVIRRVLGG